MSRGAKGIRIRVAGRLNGAEIARAEQSREGSVPLHTLRANVDYGVATSRTTYGAIGVKVWIYLGDVLPGQRVENTIAASGGKHAQDGRGFRGERGDGRGGRGGRGRRTERAGTKD